MLKFIKIIKFQIIYCIFFSVILYSLVIPLACYCYEPVQTVIITKQDILDAKPTPSEVHFSKKELHYIEIMEKRHFPRTYPELSDYERLKNLEYELLGKCWIFSPQKSRIDKLKIASSNTMLIGTALPPSISTSRIVKRMRNDNVQLRKRDDNVGLIDGFLRLLSPDLYEKYRESADRLFEYKSNIYE